ncbi:AmmeMemoRadiSam system radical SAM enzyme [candidate division WOR-3 bacterium]|nr:AmmeMemoRadiSam system radical SAM enzyme [candidate division WOR-3 bacterium]
MYEAKWYKKLSNGKVECLLCPHHCVILLGKISICKARKNTNGTLYAINYGECVSLAMDPIEKKPLYHFHPGALILSVAPNSCNFDCPFCQNAEISQSKTYTQYISPEELVDLAIKKKSLGIAYTYTEPLTWYEYLIDAGKLAHKQGIKNILVTNGMIDEKPLLELLPYMDAANIDLKSMDEGFYKKVVHGDLKTVLNTIKISRQHIWIELTNLIIPGYNDSKELISKLIDFVAKLGVNTPLHFSRYFPHYKFTVPPTPVETLKFAWELAKEKLNYVYVGNVWLEGASDTYCPECSNLLVDRSYFYANPSGIEDKKCKKCGRKVDFIL